MKKNIRLLNMPVLMFLLATFCINLACASEVMVEYIENGVKTDLSSSQKDLISVLLMDVVSSSRHKEPYQNKKMDDSPQYKQIIVSYSPMVKISQYLPLVSKIEIHLFNHVSRLVVYENDGVYALSGYEDYFMTRLLEILESEKLQEEKYDKTYRLLR